MRSVELIRRGNPCDVDFANKEIQNITQARAKGRMPCTNLEVCQQRSVCEGIQCARRVGLEMAKYILQNPEHFAKAGENERRDFLKEATEGKFWICINNQWVVVEGKINVVDHVVAFAQTVIDRQPGERRPFSADGKVPEVGLDAALRNAQLDLDDVYGELGF